MIVIILWFALLPFGLASINTTRLPSYEVSALRVIGDKLGKNWDFSKDPCTEWVNFNTTTGYDDTVLCDCGINGTVCHITSVSLKGQNLAGVLPPEFTNLSNLLNIDLTRNYLSGTIPPAWGSMGKILNISLIGNRLSGSIPKELGNLSTLTTFSVEDNMMSGVIPEELGDLASIERLFFNANFFTGRLPVSFAKLTNITEFRIGSNNFSGKIPDYIGEWKSLKSLRIQGSGLDGPIPSKITLLPKLTDLRISDLGGPDALCPPFSNTPFKTLILRNCNLFGKLPDSLPSSSLKVLDFSFNKLNGTIPNGFNDLRKTDYIYLTGNSLSGNIPDWMLALGEKIDLSYNKLTSQNSSDLRCEIRETNLFSSFSTDNTSKEVSCLGNNACGGTLSSSLYINCGGSGVSEGNKEYEPDIDSGGPSKFSSTGNRWGFSNTGHFLDDDRPDSYILTTNSTIPVLYTNARTSAISLTYYSFCMRSGSYNVSLHFAEIVFTNDTTFSSLGRRVFDIYIQGVLMEKDFDISDRAGGVGKAIVMTYTVNVASSLEIRLYWAGKGTISLPNRGTYGPLISAISVDPNYSVPREQAKGNGVSGGVVAGIVVGVFFSIVLILGVLWWLGYLRHKDTNDLDLSGIDPNMGQFTLRQIKAATNNFDVANKIGEGGFGPVYKGVLADGTLIAVKQLSAKSRQGNREFLNELGMISALQHKHLVKLHGCCIEGNQLLLAYEYMENNSLARALFGPEECQLKLDWPTRYKICIGIARGLAFLHEESRLKIVHRDIKASNVLLDKNLDAKISDFGLAKLDEEDTTHISTRIAGTYGYMAPEYAHRGYLTDKADVYSFGIVLLEIVSGTANTVDKLKENHFILLDRAATLKTTGNLLELADPRLDSKYNIQEVMVVINLGLVCTEISPTNRPAMSSVVSMLEGRLVPQEFVVEQGVSMTETKKMMKKDGNTSNIESEELSLVYTDSSVSAIDLYPVDRFSEYLQKRDSDEEK